jgi:diaminopropionate ammonia-lyase
MSGYATIVIEALAQMCSSGLERPTHVFLQGGVGGLAAAVVAYLWEVLGPAVAPIFVVVEPNQADCLYQSAIHRTPTRAAGSLATLMAGLSCGEVSRVAWPILEAGAEFFMTIEDKAAVECMRLLHNEAFGGRPIVAGESGVAGIAGLLAAANDPLGDALTRMRVDRASTVLLIGTEGATDPVIYNRLVGA